MQPHPHKKGDLKNVNQKNKRAAIVFWMGEGCTLVSQQNMRNFSFNIFLTSSIKMLKIYN